MKFSIQYVSDIHLEHHDKYNEGQITPHMFVKPSAPYLALCGDIGIPELKAYETFLQWCSNNWEKVFLVAGNHEYYTYRCPTKNDMQFKKQKIRDLVTKYPNLYFLDCDSHYLQEYNVRILGCTFWSDMSGLDEKYILQGMNDSKQIYLSGAKPALPRDFTAIHCSEKEWIQKEIESARKANESVFILTHYLPSYKLIAEKYKDNPLNLCFASHCEDLLKAPVKGWLCGHSHTGVTIQIQDVLCSLNPYGYTGERVETRDRTKVITLELS